MKAQWTCSAGQDRTGITRSPPTWSGSGRACRTRSSSVSVAIAARWSRSARSAAQRP